MKATITVGISASGKNSWANTQHAWIVCRDNFRTQMLIDDGFDATNNNIWSRWKFNKSAENEVTAKYWKLVELHAGAEQDIICCDTNLNADRRREMQNRLESLGYTVEVKQFDVTFEEAVKRDRFRKDSVGQAVIYKQWMQLYGEVYTPPADAPKAILVDIDGTLAHMDGKRGPFEWGKVGGDSCDQVVKRIVDGFSSTHNIIIMSGRDGSCYDLTKKWLDDNDVYYDRVLMRAAGDMRKDYIVKRELFETYVRSDYNVVAVIDDRAQVVREWHRLGLKVIAVGDQNIEF
jgi:predicted kinase